MDWNPIERYQCRRCKKWYQRSEGFSAACCVAHAPGDCCHFGERQIEPTPDERFWAIDDPLQIMRIAAGLEDA